MYAVLKEEIAAIQSANRSIWPTVVGVAGTAWAWLATGNLTVTLVLSVYASLLALLAVVDLRHGILPHLLTGTLALCGLVLAPLYLHVGVVNSVAGALVGFAGLGACAWLAEKLSGRPALGGGDLWLTLGIGAWVGAGGLPVFLLALAFTGVASVLGKRLRRARGQKVRIFPFGPALAFAGWLAALYAPAYWRAVAWLATGQTY